MSHTGDEGIKRQFFGDLERFFPPPKVDILLPSLQNVGLKLKQIATVSEDSVDLSFEIVGNRSMQYPIQPDKEDCSFFIRTGTCKFGPACKFNHPVLTENLKADLDKSNANGVGSSYKILSQMPCKFYPAGLCKYGEACQFNHTKTKNEISTPQLNILGLPKRLGKLNCAFYIRTGLCGYGAACIFNHPDPIMILYPESVNKRKEVVQSCKSYLSVPVMRTRNLPFVHQNYTVTNSQESNCKQRIIVAIDVTPKREPCVLNCVGLPIRPGKKVCWNYEKLGLCKLGRACAYNHPEKRLGSTSASPSGVKTQESGTPQE